MSEGLTITKPATLHELLRQALDDIELRRKEPGVEIDMTDWHRVDQDVCHMCLAGAWMERAISRGQHVSHAGYSSSPPNLFNSDSNDCFQALNSLRCGFVSGAVDEFYRDIYVKGIDVDDLDFSAHDPHTDYSDWYSQMRQLQKQLEEAGI